jgi:hypothetical protein
MRNDSPISFIYFSYTSSYVWSFFFFFNQVTFSDIVLNVGKSHLINFTYVR